MKTNTDELLKKKQTYISREDNEILFYGPQELKSNLYGNSCNSYFIEVIFLNLKFSLFLIFKIVKKKKHNS